MRAMKEQLWEVGEGSYCTGNAEVIEYLEHLRNRWGMDLRAIRVREHEIRTDLNARETADLTNGVLDFLKERIETHDDFYYEDGGPVIRELSDKAKILAGLLVSSVDEWADWSQASWRPTGTVISGAEFLDTYGGAQ